MSDGWKSIYRERPKDGQICMSRIHGEQGFCGNSIYEAKTSSFRTYRDMRNRLEITVWKHDEWKVV